jgi:hypothetical protein
MGIENIEEMRTRHKKEIEDLQNSCKHKDISDWMPYYWAIGHFSHNVRVCNFCGKTVETDQKPFNPEEWRKKK